MAHERLVGLQVSDEKNYQAYRNAMTPLLTKMGGSFRYDFKIAETLKSETSDPINRVFIISFPSQDLMEKFFSDPEYKKIKEAYFVKSVSATTIISLYDTLV